MNISGGISFSTGSATASRYSWVQQGCSYSVSATASSLRCYPISRTKTNVLYFMLQLCMCFCRSNRILTECSMGICGGFFVLSLS